MYAESNVTSCICHKLGICTLINPSVGDLIYFVCKFQALTDTGNHVTLRIHLIYSRPTFDTLFSIIYSCSLPCNSYRVYSLVSIASSRRRGKDVWSNPPLFHGPVSECCRTNSVRFTDLNILGMVLRNL